MTVYHAGMAKTKRRQPYAPPDVMNVEAQRLAKELLVWHAHIRANRRADAWALGDLAPYKKLCERAGIGGAERIVGPYLGELAEWCKRNDLPPLNSLAVNAQTRIPGVGYDGAPNCSYETWVEDVGRCLATQYPPQIP